MVVVMNLPANAAAESLQSCLTEQPHRWEPTRLAHRWDSPGKNTGVGYHFLLQCMKVESESEVAHSCPSQQPHGLQPTRLLHPWDFPGKSTGVGCHCLLCLPVQETQKLHFQFLAQKDLLEWEMATQSNILAWKIPWTEEPGRLQSVEWQTVGHDSATEHTYTYLQTQ